jgi:hypothetical protein
MTLSDAQLGKIAEVIFVMGDRAKTRLPKPANTGPAAFTAAMDGIATDARFNDAGIGVIDFTHFPANPPNVWLHNGGKPFRIGSASKIAMMLAAVQLRLDVRRILDLKIISTPREFDELFRNRKLWKKAKSPQRQMQEIADNPPLISKIFDFNKDPIDFAGPDPDKQTVPTNQTLIVNKLLPAGHLSWETAPPLTFSERFWLAGCVSDNVAATACVSEIGVPYIKAVQRSYGLADHPLGGMHLLLSGGYTGIKRSTKPPAPPPPRQLAHKEPIKVSDFMFRRGRYDNDMSWVPGSAAALTAYMIGLITDTLADPGGLWGGLVGGHAACQTIRNNLADGGAEAILSLMVDGPGVSSITTVKKQINKIGILRPEDGAENALLCEFVYLETEEKTLPPPPPPFPPWPPPKELKYAVIATGLISTSGAGNGAGQKSAALGTAVHRALLSL